MGLEIVEAEFNLKAIMDACWHDGVAEHQRVRALIMQGIDPHEEGTAPQVVQAPAPAAVKRPVTVKRDVAPATTPPISGVDAVLDACKLVHPDKRAAVGQEVGQYLTGKIDKAKLFTRLRARAEAVKAQGQRFRMKLVARLVEAAERARAGV